MSVFSLFVCTVKLVELNRVYIDDKKQTIVKKTKFNCNQSIKRPSSSAVNSDIWGSHSSHYLPGCDAV
jgi:hypothetical protein